MLQWCFCLICKGNIATPQVSLWKNDWRRGRREWKLPICHFPFADKDLLKTNTRRSLVEYSEKLNLMWSSSRKILLAFLSPKHRFLTPKNVLVFLAGYAYYRLKMLPKQASRVWKRLKNDLVPLSLLLLIRKFHIKRNKVGPQQLVIHMVQKPPCFRARDALAEKERACIV